MFKFINQRFILESAVGGIIAFGAIKGVEHLNEKLKEKQS